MQTALAVTLLLTSLTIGAIWADESEYAPNMPLKSTSSLSGDMFTNETEILTPRGIIDEPPAKLTLTQDFSPDISPAAGPGISETVPVSPTAL